MNADGFQVVRGKRAIKRRQIRLLPKDSINLNDIDSSNINIEEVMTQIDHCQSELEKSDYMNQVRDIMNIQPYSDTTQCLMLSNSAIKDEQVSPPHDTKSQVTSISRDLYHQRAVAELVCYGIGSIVNSVIARYQLTLMTILRNQLQLSPESSSVYDPMLSGADEKILSNYNYTLLSVNEEGKRLVNRCTLFYMPHCGKALYNNLLWANWHPDRLKHLVILGNSFSHMEASTPRRFLEEEGHYIIKILPFILEYPIKNILHHTDIFNDLSLHIVDMNKLHTVGESFWTDCVEPVYKNGAEDIILNKK